MNTHGGVSGRRHNSGPGVPCDASSGGRGAERKRLDEAWAGASWRGRYIRRHGIRTERISSNPHPQTIQESSPFIMVLAVTPRRIGALSRQHFPIVLAQSIRSTATPRLMSTSSPALAVRKASTAASGTAKAQLENTRTKRCERCGAVIPIVACPCPRCLDVTPLEYEHVVDSLTHHAVLGFTTPRPLADGESPAAADWAELAQAPGRGFEIDLDEIKRSKLQRLQELKPRKNHVEGPESTTWRRLARNRIARAADILSDPAERAQYIVSAPASIPLYTWTADARLGPSCQAR